MLPFDIMLCHDGSKRLLFDILRQLVVNAKIEVINVAAPISGGRDNAVRPMGIGVILFLIIKEIGIILPHDVVLVAKHKKSCGSRMLLSVRTDAHSPEFHQKVFVFQSLPYMTRAGKAHPLTIAADAFLVEDGHIHFIQNQHILRPDGRITHHSLIFLFGTFVIALPIAGIGGQGDSIQINRTIGTLGTRLIDDYDMVAVHFLHEHIFGGQ